MRRANRTGSALRRALPGVLLALGCGEALADAPGEHVVRPSSEWVPVTTCVAPAAGSALDFSGFGFTDGPCGKYGRVVARWRHFEFEKRPGAAARFYGVNLCAGCTTLPRETSRKLVGNLVRIGYNALRIHHHENALLKGEGDRMTFDAEALDRFDALIAECRARGVYVTTDLFVSRTISRRACGIDGDGDLEEAKVLVLFHPGVHSNYLAFAKGFLTHRNPYTGMALAQDPTLAWISLVNEGNLPNFGTHLLKTYADCVRPKWRKWLARRRAADRRYAGIPDALPDTLSEEAWTNRHVAAFQHFLADREAAFARKMRRWLREELGCKALVTDMNCWTFPATLQAVRAENYDYVDDHFYYTHPEFLGAGWRLPARVTGKTNIRKGWEAGMPYLASRRLLDRPFTVSEYNYCPPGDMRCAGGLLCGAAAALQDWAALWHFDWSCAAWGAVDAARRPMNHFDITGDPISLGSDRLFACLYLRRDLPALERTFATLYPPKTLEDLDAPLRGLQTAVPWVGWRAHIGGLYASSLPDGWESMGPYTGVRGEGELMRDLGLASVETIRSPDGGFAVDRRNETLILATARTAGGFLPSAGRIEAGALSAEVSAAPAAVWASSLGKAPLARAPRILCSVLTDALQDGMRFRDATREVLVCWGDGGRKLMRRTHARISLALEGDAEATAYSLRPDGARRRRLPVEMRDGRLLLDVDTAGDGVEAEYLFEIVRKEK